MTEAHSQRAHAKLAPSSASRWMACAGSVRLSEGVEESASPYAAQGTAAHELLERCITSRVDPAVFKGECIGGFAVDADMISAVRVCCELAEELREQSEDFAVEQRMDMSALVPGVYGTGDIIAYGAGRVTIVDYKHGQGVAVEVEGNEQLLTYAMGVAQRYHNRGVDEVELVIVQPRAPHRDGPVRRWSTDIIGLYEHVMALQVAAEAASDPDAPFNPGKGCVFCKAAGKCAALRTRVMEIVMNDPSVAPYRDWKDEEADIALVKTWARRREEFAHAEALRGRMPPGAKLVGKRAIRKWKDDNEAVATLQMLGVPDDDIFETTLRSPAQVEKALPKKDKPAIGALAIKASSGTVLAPADDPRPSVDPNNADGFDVMED